MSNKTITRDAVKDQFVAQLRPLSLNGSSIGMQVRDQAEAALAHLDIPTRKWEAWKYTNLKPVVSRTYTLASDERMPESIDSFLIPDLEADVLVFVDGKYIEALSRIQYNQEVLQFSNLSNLSGELLEVFESRFGQIIEPDKDIFAALNTAFGKNGTVIRVPKGKIAKAPIHILHLAQANEANIAIQNRNLFVVEDNAEAKVIESFHTIGTGVSLRNNATEIFVGKNAGLEYIKLQLESDQASQIDQTEIHQEADSRMAIFTITLSGDIVRNNLRLRLMGQNCESNLMGTYLLSGLQHVDNHTKVDHALPHCYSNELYKGIIDEKATAAFNGMIHVYPDAQKTNAFQSNRNILLSDTANIYTKPQLEIYADDVKCSHGATTGRLDEEAMFYLRARGISEYRARIMLIYAFTMEVVNHMTIEPVKAFVSGLIENRY